MKNRRIAFLAAIVLLLSACQSSDPMVDVGSGGDAEVSDPVDDSSAGDDADGDGGGDAGGAAPFQPDPGEPSEGDNNPSPPVEDQPAPPPPPITEPTEDDPPAETPEAAEDPADVAAGQRANEAATGYLVGEGFTDDGVSDTRDGSSDFEFESPECERFAEIFQEGDRLPGQTADVEGHTHSRGEFTAVGGLQEEVSTMVVVTASPGDQSTIYEVVGDPAFVRCIREAVEKAVEEEGGAEFEVTAEETLSALGVGDQGAGIRLAGIVRSGALEVDFEVILHFERAGRASGGLFFVGIGGDESTLDRTAAMRALLDPLRGL